VRARAIREVLARMPPAKRPIPLRWRVGVAMIRLEVHSATSGLTAGVLTELETPEY
jgi:hypothetical protein